MTAPQIIPLNNSSLYNQDFYLWLEATANQLKEGRFNEIDLDNLIEEIESMGRSEKHALESNLVVILMHLIKYKYQPQKRSNRWLSTIIEYRRRLRRSLKDSPSLNHYLNEVFDECYQDARKQAALETNLSLDSFPLECVFTLEETLDSDFLPE